MTVIYLDYVASYKNIMELRDEDFNETLDVIIESPIFFSWKWRGFNVLCKVQKKGSMWLMRAIQSVNTTVDSYESVALTSNGWFIIGSDGKGYNPDGVIDVIDKADLDIVCLVIRYGIYRFFCTENPISRIKTITGNERKKLKIAGCRGNKYHVLSIKPPVPKTKIRHGKSGDVCFKKRLHECRGHWRKYRDGRRVWVKAHFRGDKKIGVVKKDYSIEG